MTRSTGSKPLLGLLPPKSNPWVTPHPAAGDICKATYLGSSVLQSVAITALVPNPLMCRCGPTAGAARPQAFSPLSPLDWGCGRAARARVGRPQMPVPRAATVSEAGRWRLTLVRRAHPTPVLDPVRTHASAGPPGQCLLAWAVLPAWALEALTFPGSALT